MKRRYKVIILSLFVISNALTYAYDSIKIGKTFTFVTTCDTDKRFAYVIGKGWGCTKSYYRMNVCFEDWKFVTNQNDCKLLRTFEMNPFHVHRWLAYLLESKWHHSYYE